MAIAALCTAFVLSSGFSVVPRGGVELHVSVIPSEIKRLASLHRRVVWPFAQCFSALTVVVDPPHGGKTYGETRQSDPVYLPVDDRPILARELRQHVRVAIAPSVQMLTKHCRRPPRLKVAVLNHTRLDTNGWLDRRFIDPPTTSETQPVFRDVNTALPRPQRFFKNTVMYVWSVSVSHYAYQLHVDIDTLGLFNEQPSVGRSPAPSRFVDHAIQILKANRHRLFVTPCKCDGHADIIPGGVSTRIFVVDTRRFCTMLPLVGWADHVEEMIGRNMRRHNFSTVVTPHRPCIGSSFFTRKILHNVNW